jgi:hypothetical protein
MDLPTKSTTPLKSSQNLTPLGSRAETPFGVVRMVQFVPHSKLKKSSENAEQEFLIHVFNQPWSAFVGHINFVGFD